MIFENLFSYNFIHKQCTLVMSPHFSILFPPPPTKSLLPTTYQFEECGFPSPRPFTASKPSATGGAS